jgi:hypothetical protein
MPIRDDAFTNPESIRATYASRGRNAKLNIAKAESLGINASQLAAARAKDAGSLGGSAAAGGSGGGGGVIDPTLQYQGQETYQDTSFETVTYEGSMYKVDPIDGGGFDPAV